MTTPSEPAPAELRALAADAVHLAGRIQAAYDRMRSSMYPEVRRAGFRLDSAGPGRPVTRLAVS